MAKLSHNLPNRQYIPTLLGSIQARPAVCCPFAWGLYTCAGISWSFNALATALALIAKPISGIWVPAGAAISLIPQQQRANDMSLVTGTARTGEAAAVAEAPFSTGEGLLSARLRLHILCRRAYL